MARKNHHPSIRACFSSVVLDAALDIRPILNPIHPHAVSGAIFTNLAADFLFFYL